MPPPPSRPPLKLTFLAVVTSIVVASISGCGGSGPPTDVSAADLEGQSGEFWISLTPDLKEELVEAGKNRLGSERPDGSSQIHAAPNDDLIAEIDQEYENESKRDSTIYDIYVGANDELARETFEGLIRELQEGG
jgi:hypothetical protein